MNAVAGPNVLIWDVTFACPLRCSHCYTESGRRRPQNLSHEEMLRVADALITFRPAMITLCGGEPLTVPRIVEVVERFATAGVRVFLYTSGWSLPEQTVRDLAGMVAKLVVSVDGATAQVHDRIRGRAGSFDRAMAALALLDAESARRAAAGESPLRFGIDNVVVRSNYHQLDEMCASVAPRFPHLSDVAFGAVVPTGLASRVSYGDHEMLTDEQVTALVDEGTRQRLQQAAPASVTVTTTDNFGVQMHPDYVASHPDFRPLEIEPDGEVRAMPIYEGTVGSLLTEDPFVLWERARSRWHDPFVLECLRGIRTRRDWAEAVRRIDYRFGSDQVRARIDGRPVFDPAQAPRQLALRSVGGTPTR
ncbi:radical SAM protein [Plantactinospora soyae]|uniref:MoaA/NifB/PqqE/SkfB family radical SAM enzyme n=1 Tax=Plantactinospora soyae TaxID=1544732 RepID=A0A927M7H4_9ACTN|nr:radical SAM protein [Plantactinospora soyae]MBE1489588.1 MoaA/NifB/PqqE/SkfB family radical SAM enzyme [Plantactinospora soyae]